MPALLATTALHVTAPHPLETLRATPAECATRDATFKWVSCGYLHLWVALQAGSRGYLYTF